MSLIGGSIAELALAQRSPRPGRILFAGVVRVPRCCRVIHEPVPGSRAQTRIWGCSCAANLQKREHQRLWLGLALLKILFLPLRPGWCQERGLCLGGIAGSCAASCPPAASGFAGSGSYGSESLQEPKAATRGHANLLQRAQH